MRFPCVVLCVLVTKRGMRVWRCCDAQFRQSYALIRCGVLHAAQHGQGEHDSPVWNVRLLRQACSSAGLDLAALPELSTVQIEVRGDTTIELV